MLMTKADFVQMVVNDLMIHEIPTTIKFSSTLGKDFWMGPGYVGIFSTAPLEFQCAMGGPAGFESLIHEYNHFMQSLEDPVLWERGMKSAAVFFNHLPRPFPKRRIPHHTNTILEVEHDCERRSLQMIRDLKLPVKLRDYAQQASMYLFCYTAAREFGVWKKSPQLCNKKILSQMPTRLRELEYYLDISNVPKEMLSFFKKQLG